MAGSLFNEDSLVLSANYAETMNTVVVPYLTEHGKIRHVPGRDNYPLEAVVWQAKAPRGTVVVVHGFTENAFKFSELIYSLLASHFSVVALDQRGHGHSGRLPGLKDASVTHVDRFADYIQDLKAVTDRLLPDMPKPRMIFAHSMGGAVTSLFLEQYPEVFSRCVLCAPMIAPNLSGIPPRVAGAICTVSRGLLRERRNPFFTKRYAGPEDFDTSPAASRERFDWYDAIKAAHPEFQNSCPSYKWIQESIGVTDQILAPGAPESIVCPLRLYSAETDFSVLPEPQQAFIARVPHGERKLVPGSRHEIYRSPDDVLFPWWHEILAFFGEAEKENPA